jgi:hypothetical protein
LPPLCSMGYITITLTQPANLASFRFIEFFWREQMLAVWFWLPTSAKTGCDQPWLLLFFCVSLHMTALTTCTQLSISSFPLIYNLWRS